MTNKNKYVFVVCGDDKHIQTLNFSLRYLKHFSSNAITVITDKARNSIAIEHDHIIHVDTPGSYNNHQASIYLKTSLHRYLDLTDNYCYLDSDVIALSKNVDTIFNHFIAPITFAPDHCRINEFSPYAIKCNCMPETKKNIENLENLVEKFNPYFTEEKKIFNPLIRELRRIISKAKNKPLKNIFFLLKYVFGIFILPKKIFKLNDNIYFNKKDKTWCDKNGNIFLYHALNYYKQVQKLSPFIYKIPQFDWYNEKGNRLYSCTCNHLTEEIQSKFKVNISEKTWQHWNGGVFLFNKESVDFLETWHKHTLEIFNDPEWETRDQGTLALTVWEKGLQNHPILKKEYNFIADYNNPMITFDVNKGFTADNFGSVIDPSFIHVYHNFGLHGWEIWDAIEILNDNLKIATKTQSC